MLSLLLHWSTDDLLVIGKKARNQPPVMARYWEEVDQGDPRALGHLALRQLEWNAGALGVNGDAVARLRLARDHYSGFSHCGTVTIASRVAPDRVGTVLIGGHFDEAKLAAYRVEMHGRIGLCRVLPPFMAHLLASINLSPGAGPDAPLQRAKPA